MRLSAFSSLGLSSSIHNAVLPPFSTPRRCFSLAEEKAGVVIVGGGVMGSATAYFLSAIHGRKDVVVVEKDPSYQYSASALSAASIRHQFSTQDSVRMSLFGSEFLKNVHQLLEVEGQQPYQVDLVERGYLFLGDAKNASNIKKNTEDCQAVGGRLALLSQEELRQRYPWMSSEDLAIASIGLDGTGQGWFDAYGLAMAFRRKAIASGVCYVCDEAVGFRMGRAERIEGVALRGGEELTLKEGGEVLNAAGTCAPLVHSFLPEELRFADPVRTRKRYVFVFQCEDDEEIRANCPMVIDPTGLYFRPDGANRYICGIIPEEDPDVELDDFNVQDGFFEEYLWPLLAERVPKFDCLKVTNSWAGHYDMNLFDANAFLGRHPNVANLLVAYGFSGHGMQHSPAVGRGMAELIVHGEYKALDLSRFSPERFLKNDPIKEDNVY